MKKSIVPLDRLEKVKVSQKKKYQDYQKKKSKLETQYIVAQCNPLIYREINVFEKS